MQEGKFYIGIDWATEKHAICVMEANGKIVKERTVPNDNRLFDALAEVLGGTTSCEVLVAVETRRLALVDALVARGFLVFTINPKQSERFRERFSVAGAKDDRLDARVLASALRTDTKLFRRVEPETEELVQLRAATRLRQTIQEQSREVANRLRDVVISSMPSLLGLCNGADEAWFWDLALLAHSPESARLVTAEQLTALLRRHRIRRLSARVLLEVLHGPHLAAAPGVCSAAAWQAHLLIEQLRLLEEHRRVADAAVVAAVRGLPRPDGTVSDAEIIMSAPGFAEQTTGVLLAEAGAVVARRDYNELRAICGVAPVTKASGKRRKQSTWTKGMNADGVVAMRRATNMRLRNAAHHAGAAASRDPRFAPIYTRLRAAGATHARAVRGVVDRLLRVLIAMLRDRSLFSSTAGPSVEASAAG